MHLAILTLSDKDYAVDVSRIQEVIRFKNVTDIPEAAAYIEGVIQFRRRIVPLVNLRQKLDLGTAPLEPSAKIMVISQGEDGYLGLVVDNIKDIILIKETQIEIGGDMLKEAYYLQGFINVSGQIIPVLDMNKLFSSDEQDGINQIHQRVEIRRTGQNK